MVFVNLFLLAYSILAYTTCQNINQKPPGFADDECIETPAKRSKLENRTLHNYPELENKESNKTNLGLLVAEVQESIPSTTRITINIENGSLGRLTQSKLYVKSIQC